ncbi:MAG TPA: tRNA-uridine aminocarboxypropyltransferase [Polyangiaceae bacterium]|nr:tRNA-uridine aminocarboxypropyltransferase [Polyangiaceae bacterium]
MFRPTPAAAPERPTCYRCFRPAAFCLCAVIPIVANRTEVLIVQHPRERTHPFGTARLAELGLSRVEVLVDYAGRLRRDPTPLGALAGAALLYPHATARDVNLLGREERPSRLVVIDGTWHHARTLYRDIPVLHTLPHLTLPGHLRSAFQLRRQPNLHCLSTIEAVVHALRALEPETLGLTELLTAFDAMQSGQLALPRDSGRSRKDLRPKASRALPRGLLEGYASLVVAYAESTLDPSAPHGRRLLCCAAARPATGERFHRVVRHTGLSDAHIAHLGSSREQLEAGVSPEVFRAEWSSFLGGSTNLAAWNQSTLDLLCDAAGSAPAGFTLKAAYHNLRRHRGSLEDVVRLEELPAARAGGEGDRAWQRLCNALDLALFLRRHGSGHE